MPRCGHTRDMTTTQQPTATATTTEIALNTKDHQGALTTTYLTPGAARELARQLELAAFKVDGIA
jgi:hypothetical protein